MAILACREFTLGSWDDYETHFTVMNYGDSDLKQVSLITIHPATLNTCLILTIDS